MSSLLTFGLGDPAHLMLTFGLGDHGTVAAEPGVYRDDAVMEDAGARLADLGQFDAIYVGARPDEMPHPASATYAAAWVWVDMAEDVEIFPASGLYERDGMFGIAIEVRDANPLERMRRLARLENAAKNAVQGQRLAGATYPNSVKVRRQGRDFSSDNPAARVVLVGRYRYPVGGLAAADESDRESSWN